MALEEDVFSFKVSHITFSPSYIVYFVYRFVVSRLDLTRDTVLEGKELYKKDCSCFCELSYGNLKEKTRTIAKGDKMAWREEFVL
jgi:hypothetical protein